mgnify:CR=1 FL=1
MKASVYTRPNKPTRLTVRRREDPAPMEARTLAPPIAVDRATECHVTPPDVASYMVDCLEGVGDYQTLEPSAGTGALLRALKDAGQSSLETIAIERHHELARVLERQKFGTVIHECFLDYAARAAGRVDYVHIIMNPPFRQVRQHMNAALSLLGRNGHAEPARLVALVPVTYDHPEAELMDTLGPDTFASAKVHTKIIRISR